MASVPTLRASPRISSKIHTLFDCIPDSVYHPLVTRDRGKRLFVLKGEIKTPPMSKDARGETGWLLRHLQEGETLGMPHFRPMPGIGQNCHELRVNDKHASWRVVYYVAPSELTSLIPQRILSFRARLLAGKSAVLTDGRY